MRSLYRVAERIISRNKKFSRKSFLAADAFRLKEIVIGSPSREIVYVGRVVATDASEISMRRDGCGETEKLYNSPSTIYNSPRDATLFRWSNYCRWSNIEEKLKKNRLPFDPYSRGTLFQLQLSLNSTINHSQYLRLNLNRYDNLRFV